MVNELYTILSIIFLLLLLSAFFSGAETALTAASKPLMHNLERNGNSRAKIVNQLLSSKDRLIGSILLGNNLVNILASALATSFLITIFGEAGIFYATVTMTFMVLIFAEILPKSYAIHNANRIALGLAYIIRLIVFFFTPVTVGIISFVNLILRTLKLKDKKTDFFDSSEEELRGAIELHEGDDTKTIKNERAMLRSVLDLGEVQVHEIMTHRTNTATIDVDQPPEDAVKSILKSPYTRIPIWQNSPDNIIGIIHAKALLQEIHKRKGDLKRLSLSALASEPWFIPEQTLLLDQLEAFRKRREHFSLVVDEYGSLMGVVTLEDIIEEIVGPIDDEHDLAMTDTQKEEDGTYVVDGSTTIRDLNREHEWGLPDEEAATIAGLILYESRRIPQIHQSFIFHGFRFDILERQRHQITSIRITPPQKS